MRSTKRIVALLTALPVLSVCLCQALPDKSTIEKVLRPEGGYRVRAMAVQRLGGSLGTNDIASLCVFLSSPVSAHPELTTNALASLKNEVLNVLCTQERLPESLGQELLANYTNQGNDPVWRSFCLQHFLKYYWRRWLRPPFGGGATNGFEGERVLIESNLWAAARGPDDELCGIALHVLDFISKSNATVAVTQVVAVAVVAANDASRSPWVRARAIEIASRRPLPHCVRS